MSSTRSNPATPLPAPTELEQAALNWFARCNRGLTPEQETEFQDWLAADPRHAKLFNEFDGTWELLGRAGEELPVPATVSPVAGPRWRPSHVFRTLASLTAVAAALAISYIGWWRPAHYSGEAITEIGALRTLRLPDGSLVTLNTDSAVTAAFTPGERRVRLEHGEAHFAVAKNATRPFIVEAGGVTVRAVGTAFNVRLELKSVEVLVTEGKVRVDDSVSGKSLLARSEDSSVPSSDLYPLTADRFLTSGQRVVVVLPELVPAAGPVESPVASVPVEEIRRELAWQEGRLDFVSAPLADIVEEFNRYNKHKLVIADPALAATRFGGSFKPDDPEGLVRRLRENFGIIADVSETRTMLRNAR